MKNPYWVVKQVKPNKDYTILLTFEDGKRGVYYVKPLLRYKICEPLKNIGFFMLAHTDGSTVVWNDQLDLDPESLYMDSKPI